MNMNDVGVHNLEQIILFQGVGGYGPQYIALARAYNGVKDGTDRSIKYIPEGGKNSLQRMRLSHNQENQEIGLLVVQT